MIYKMSCGIKDTKRSHVNNIDPQSSSLPLEVLIATALDGFNKLV
jgi:hypothetical protein